MGARTGQGQSGLDRARPAQSGRAQAHGRCLQVRGIDLHDDAGSARSTSMVAPSAVDDAITVDFESAATVIDVLANDSDPDNDTLTITAVSTPMHGTAVISAGGVSYTPMAGYSGSDSFTYTISDGRGGTATASVNVTVNPAAESNQAPVAVDDDGGVLKGLRTDIDVLANDSDPDGDPLDSRVRSSTPARATPSSRSTPTIPCTTNRSTASRATTFSSTRFRMAAAAPPEPRSPFSSTSSPAAENDAYGPAATRSGSSAGQRVMRSGCRQRLGSTAGRPRGHTAPPKDAGHPRPAGSGRLRGIYR